MERFPYQKQELPPVQEKKREIEEIEITEELVDENIKENPDGFIGWFEALKNSIAGWPKKFFENKTIRNAIIYASIPFAILQASQPKLKAEELAGEFIKRPAISEKIKAEQLEQKIKAEDLAALADKNQKEVLAQRINLELNAFNKLSEPFNDAVKEKPDLFPKKIIEKVAGGEKIFDFAGRINSNIKEANDYFKDLSGTEEQNMRLKKRETRVKRILERGRLNLIEAAKTIPEIILAQKWSVLIHELGHEKEALAQGAKNTKIGLNLFGGYTEWHGEVKNRAAIIAAGIKADKEYGDFLINTLREQDAPSQLLAIMALVAKSDGMKYALLTNLSEVMREREGNDIVNYAKETNTSLSELALGLMADFILDKDNWQLMKIASGKAGIQMSKYTIAPMYELWEHGPITGLKFKGVF